MDSGNTKEIELYNHIMYRINHLHERTRPFVCSKPIELILWTSQGVLNGEGKGELNMYYLGNVIIPEDNYFIKKSMICTYQSLLSVLQKIHKSFIAENIQLNIVDRLSNVFEEVDFNKKLTQPGSVTMYIQMTQTHIEHKEYINKVVSLKTEIDELEKKLIQLKKEYNDMQNILKLNDEISHGFTYFT
ncbi:MAG: hypothetical protein Edafosvirus3_76 [Edafosvirus sp.]|uniref:Uncharacterized protein n=1 Tax=Edafosvirus sp. TaxID=2487765 RepID=A0A3G4ZSY4_9VIRU|nr:MAG: hypothetical protein Edafosvirus3_76 [Edafosvirus sp.]